MDPEEDLYKILGIEPSATQEDVKSAFKGLTKKHHPDLNPGDAKANDRFRRIVGAHEVLSDPERRRRYDASRQGFVGRYGAPRSDGKPGQTIEDISEALFQSFLRRDASKKVAPDGIPDPAEPWREPQGDLRKGKDIRETVFLSLEEAVNGTEMSIETVGGQSRCDRCGGKGGEPGSPVLPCMTCGGTGNTLNRKSVSVCRNCKGYRTVAVKVCQKCGGKGTQVTARRVRFKVPSGVEDGTELRLAGMGSPGDGGPGDLYISVRLREHDEVLRKGKDLYVTAKVPIRTALMGGRASVTVLGRTVAFDVSSSSFLKGEPEVVRGEGIRPPLGSSSGDLYVKIAVDVGELSPRAVRLIEELDEEVRSRRPQ